MPAYRTCQLLAARGGSPGMAALRHCCAHNLHIGVRWGGREGCRGAQGAALAVPATRFERRTWEALKARPARACTRAAAPLRCWRGACAGAAVWQRAACILGWGLVTRCCGAQ